MADAKNMSKDDALIDVIARCESAAAHWFVGGDCLVSEACMRAMIGEHSDVHSAIRAAAPVVLAVEQTIREMTQSLKNDNGSSDKQTSSSTKTEEKQSTEQKKNNNKKPPLGATIVELCGPSSGHIVGVLLQHLLPRNTVQEIVLVDPRWPARSEKNTNNESTFPVDHLDALSKKLTKETESYGNTVRDNDEVTVSMQNDTKPTQTSPSPQTIVPWKASIKTASHLRSLHNALRRATEFENRSGLLFIGRKLSGILSLRTLQLFESESTVPVGVVIQPGPAPEKIQSLKNKYLWRVGLHHFCTARQIWPVEKKEVLGFDDKAHGQTDGAKSSAKEASLARRKESETRASALFLKHIKCGLEKCNNGVVMSVIEYGHGDVSVLCAPRPADKLNRNEVNPFPACSLTIVEQMTRVNELVFKHLGEVDGIVRPANQSTRSENISSYFPCSDMLRGVQFSSVAGVVLRRCEPSRWREGGYCDEHYVIVPPEPHGVCYEAIGVDVDGGLLVTKNVGFVSIASHEKGGDDDESESNGRSNGRYLTRATITRLCVLRGARGVGVTEALLSVANGFHKCGLPVTVKTASEKAYASFLKMTGQLKFVGFKDPSSVGVGKTRGVKTVVVVDSDVYAKSGDYKTHREASSRWYDDSDDKRDYEKRWGNGKSNEDSKQSTNGSTMPTSKQTRVDTLLKQICGVMNRTAPDTICQSVIGMNKALTDINVTECTYDDSTNSENSKDTNEENSSAAAAIYFTKRVWHEPRYSTTFAKITKGVVCQVFRQTVLETATIPFRKDTLKPGGPGAVGFEILRNVSVFFSSLVTEDVFSNLDDYEPIDTIKKTVVNLIQVSEKETADMFTGVACALRALCVFVESGAMLSITFEGEKNLRENTRLVLVNATAPSCPLGKQSAFAAERALRVLEGSKAGEGTHAHGTGVNTPQTTCGFAHGRGQSLSRKETHAEAVREFSRIGLGRNNNRPTLQIVEKGSAKAVERGMRQGWVFAYVGVSVEERL